MAGGPGIIYPRSIRANTFYYLFISPLTVLDIFVFLLLFEERFQGRSFEQCEGEGD
jgi:hypothetical protein